MRIAAVAAWLVLGCGGGKSAPQQPPLSNTAPTTAEPAPRRTSECSCPECTMSQKVLTAFCEYTNQVCACNDMECMTRASEGWSVQAGELAKEASAKPREVSEEDKLYFEKHTKRLTECTMKLTEAMTKNAGGTGSGGTP